jgi:hypothetical protein
MRTRKPVGTLLTLAVGAGLCGAAQVAPARQDAPPHGLVVLKLKTERRLDVSHSGSRTDGSLRRTVSEPDAVNNPVEIPTTRRSQSPQRVSEYAVEVRNDGAKKIAWLSWNYVLREPGGRRESGRWEFVSPEKIGPGKTKTLRGRTRSADAPVKGASQEERVEIRCVAYEDGTRWRNPAVPESECAEAERRALSR